MKTLRKKISKEQNGSGNSRKKFGITLLVLVITIILILILASAIIITLSKTNPVDEANEAVLKNDLQAMKDNYEIKYKDLLYDKLGDETKIKDSDFDDVIPDKYKEDFIAGKDGIEYIGEDEKIKDIVEEMGIGKEKGDNLENVVAIAGIGDIQIEVIVKKQESVKEYHYYIREKGTEEWKEYTSDKNNMLVDGLKEQTTYEVKVKIVGKDGKEEESRIKEVTTKGINAGILIMRENDKNGKEYIEGTWSKENIYIEVSGENTTYTCTGANEVGKTEKASILENEGITKVTVETKVGTNIARKEYEIKIDKTAPEGNIVEKVQKPQAKNDTDMIVKVEGNDKLSGVKEYEFYLDAKPMVVTKEKEYRYENLTDGKHEIKIVVVDKAGNRKEIIEEVEVGIPDVGTIKVEKTPTGWTNGDVTLKITYGGNDTYIPQYKEENGNWKDVSRNYEVKITENKKVYVRYIYRDENKEITSNEKEIIIDNIDKVVPEILSLTSSNTNATNQNVTLTAKARDNLSGIVAYQFSTDGNLTVSSTGWKNITNTKVEMTQTLEVSANGTYYFYVKDEAGNVSKKEIEINNIDKTAPTLTSIAVTSPATGIYKAGQTITMVATYSENIKGTVPVLKIKFGTGTEKTATAGTINGKTITYTYTIASGDNGKLTSTSYTGSVTDAAGNGLTVSNKALTGNSITADTVVPTLSGIAVTGPATGIYKAGQVVTMVATYSENIKGTVPVLKIKFGTGTERTATAGTIQNNTITYTYTIASGDNGKLTSTSYTGSITDAAGNSLTLSNRALTGNNITADTTLPSTTAPTLTSNTDSITATFKQTDANINNATRQYAIKKTSDSEWGAWITSNTESYTFTGLTDNNEYQIKTKVSDNAGNTSESNIASIHLITLVKPTITAPTEWTNQDVIATITYQDIPGTTGQYSLDGKSWTNATGITQNVTVTQNNTTVYARVINSGNQTSETATYKVTCIDKELPVVSSINKGTSKISDPTFKTSLGNAAVYNNEKNGTVTVNRVSASPDIPTDSAYMLEIKTTGYARPGLGGMVQSVNSQNGYIFRHRIIAKIPVGYKLNRLSNSCGTGAVHTWFTPQDGTGDWEVYEYEVKCGSGGTFSDFGHIYLEKTTATSDTVTWHVAYANIIDLNGGGAFLKFGDPAFLSGLNGMNAYNNAGNGSVTLSRVQGSADLPSTSGYMVEVKTTGTASPGLGGYWQAVNAMANQVYRHRIIAKIPVGYRINNANNSIGNNSYTTWLTSQEGTGNWEVYEYQVKCGDGGTFSTFGHVYVEKTTATADNITWQVAYSTIIDEGRFNNKNNMTFFARDNASGIQKYGFSETETTEPPQYYTNLSNPVKPNVSILDIAIHQYRREYLWVSDSAGNVKKIRLRHFIAPYITKHPSNVSVQSGNNATFSVSAKTGAPETGNYVLKYKWQYRTSSSGSWGDATAFSTSPSYTFASSTSKNGWQYRCVVANGLYTVYSNAATLRVSAPAHTCNTNNYCTTEHSAGFTWYDCTCGNPHTTYRHPMCSVCGKRSPVTWWKCPWSPEGSGMPCA